MPHPRRAARRVAGHVEPGPGCARDLGAVTGRGCSCSARGRTAAMARWKRPASWPRPRSQAATEAGDNWAIAWALHVLTIVTTMQGRMADALPLFDRALTVTEADPALTDLRLLLQINKAVSLAALDRYEEAFAAVRQARAPCAPGRCRRPAGAGADRTGPAVLRHRAGGTMRMAEVEILPRGPEGARARPAATSASPPSSASIAAISPRHAVTWLPPRHTPSGSGTGSSARWRWPAAWTASRPTCCPRRSPC